MKRIIRKYKQYELKQIQDKLSDKNKKLIREFLLFCGTTAGKSKLKNIERVMVKIADIFNCDLDKITLEQLREFLNLLKNSNLMPPTKNEMKKHLKRFLKEKYPNWSKRFKELKEIKIEKEVNKEKINSNTLLSEKDIELLMRACGDIAEKTLISILWELAARPEEVLKLRWRDVNIDKGFIKLLSSKTGETRELPIINSIPHLKRLRTEYPYVDRNNDDFIFSSSHNREKHLSIVTLDRFIRRAGKRVFKNDRPCYPYLIRHSRLKILQKKLPSTLYEKFAGHSIEVANKFYNHMDTDDLREVLMEKVYEIENLTEEQTNKLKKEIEEIKTILKTLLLKDVVEIHLLDKKIKNPQEMDVVELADLIIKNREKGEVFLKTPNLKK